MRIKGYNGYEIYPETGQVWSYKRKKFLNSHKRKDGYYSIELQDDEKKGQVWKLHRLVYTAVYGDIPEGMQVNHIDENKENNSISNLNLLTCKENVNWGTALERRVKKRSKSVIGLKDGKVVLYFKSGNEALRYLGHKMTGTISSCCIGKRKTAFGYEWKYVDDYLAEWWEQEMDKE